MQLHAHGACRPSGAAPDTTAVHHAVHPAPCMSSTGSAGRAHMQYIIYIVHLMRTEHTAGSSQFLCQLAVKQMQTCSAMRQLTIKKF